LASETVIRLHPQPSAECALRGLYLDESLHRRSGDARPLIYTNFVSSLDGRIALEDRQTGRSVVPGMIANPRDWRLFQELAAQADVLLASARYVRQLALGRAQDVLPLSDDPQFRDLHDWRRAQGLAPQPAVVILSASLDLPLAGLCDGLEREVFVATGRGADDAASRVPEGAGVRLLRVGTSARVEGQALLDALGSLGFRSIYSIAGPGVLEGKNETSIYLPSHPTVGACFLQARTKPVASGMPGPTRPSGPPGPAEQCLCRHRGCQQPRDPRQRSGPALGGLACFRIRRTHHPPGHGYLWLFLGGC